MGRGVVCPFIPGTSRNKKGTKQVHYHFITICLFNRLMHGTWSYLMRVLLIP